MISVVRTINTTPSLIAIKRTVAILCVMLLPACQTVNTLKEKLPDLPKLPQAGPKYAQFKSTEAPHTLMTKPVATGTLTSGYGFRLSPTGIRLPKKHKGIDYKAPVGTPIYAAGDGVVIAKRVSTSYGNYVKISHDNGFSSAYAHLDGFAPSLERGTEVKRGQVIGYVGNTGRSTAAHLHYELLYRGKRVDPLFATR